MFVYIYTRMVHELYYTFTTHMAVCLTESAISPRGLAAISLPTTVDRVRVRAEHSHVVYERSRERNHDSHRAKLQSMQKSAKKLVFHSRNP